MRCRRATAWTPRPRFPGPAFAAMLVLAGGPVLGQPRPPGPANPTPLAAERLADPSAPPAPDRAMAIYSIVEPWIRQGAVPQNAGAESLAGAGITLRLAGQIVGRGVDAGGDTAALARAVRSAVDEAALRMPIEKDALREEAMAEARQRLCISLELAGPLIPYAPRLYDQVDLEVQVGLEGVAARQGERVAAVFPATMLASNSGPGDALAAAIAQVTGDPTLAIRAAADSQPAAVSKKHGLTLYRFKVTHLAQTGPGRPPMFLFRGGKVVPASEIDSEMLSAFADGLAHHLLGRKWPGDEPLGLLGTAWPAQGKYEPLTASSIERALVALALQRYLERGGARVAPGTEARKSIDELIDGLLRSIAASHLDKRDASAATAALCEPVMLARRGGAERFDRAVAFDSYIEAAGDDAARQFDGVPAGERAIVAWARSRRAEFTRAAGDIAGADALVRRIFRDTSPGQLPSQMPWLGWAELALTRARGDGEVKSGPALREMREQIWKHQLTAADCGADGPDLVGGIVFTASTNPLPTAVSLRPLAFAATMLGERSLTEDRELPRELSRVLAALRFTRQLAADEATGFMYQDPSRAMWGIRSALWDQRQPPEATAMALLMVVETLEALEARSGRAAEAPEPAPAGSPKSP
ncbi:MAG: hypothetical protein IT436_09525 [Phycisphaerales bacterium]|nr:hypothetical protein [Phycisphaerales bacterium]